MDDAGDGPDGVEPEGAHRRAERDDDLLAGQHVGLGQDEHAVGGEVDDVGPDEA